nr:hypothetical protein [uncultured Flavobacterium sp.]
MNHITPINQQAYILNKKLIIKTGNSNASIDVTLLKQRIDEHYRNPHFASSLLLDFDTDDVETGNPYNNIRHELDKFWNEYRWICNRFFNTILYGSIITLLFIIVCGVISGTSNINYLNMMLIIYTIYLSIFIVIKLLKLLKPKLCKKIEWKWKQ